MEIQYEVSYKKNAKRIIIKPDFRGGLKITAPYGVTKEKIRSILIINESKLKKYIKKDLSKLYYLGEEYKVIDNLWDMEYKILKDEKRLVVFRKKEDNLQDILEKWLKNEAKKVLSKRVKFYSGIMNVKVKSIKIKNLSTIWGSCNSKGELSFNYLLIKTPIEEVDYVVVHELSHIKHLDHSKKFWNLVGSIIPDYKKRESWLKENFISLI
jgi:predicted metal-dependent hydrolase